jgi:XTP/dITP diphosphohydrolase
MKQQLVLASGNAAKLRELQQLLADFPLEVLAQSALNVDSVPETGLTFVENALIKARHVCRQTGLPAIADDSGIEVDALMGRPGIYSARYAGEGATDTDNNTKLIKALTGVAEAQRTARYHCVLIYLRHAEDPTPLICHGTWEGIILNQARGSGGFGYDPLFWVATHSCSAAELTAAEKNRLSHRGKAMAELQRQMRERGV